MDSTKKSAIVVGASGLVGEQLMKQLLDDDRFEQVIAWVRTPLNLSHQKLTQVKINFDAMPQKIDASSNLLGYCCLGTTLKKAGGQNNQFKIDYEYVTQFALICHKNGVENFSVISSLGAEHTSTNFYLRTKGKMEEALKAIGFEHLLILRPSLLLGNRIEFRFAERVLIFIMNRIKPFLSGQLSKYKPIDVSRVAACMIRKSLTSTKKVSIIESNEI